MVAALIIANVVVVIVVYFFSFVFLRRRAKKKSLLFCCVPSRNWRSRRNVVVIRTYTVFLSTYSDPKRSVAWPCIVSLFCCFSSHTHSIFFSLASKRQLLGNSLQGCNHLLEWVRCSQISRKHPWRRKIARLLYIFFWKKEKMKKEVRRLSSSWAFPYLLSSNKDEWKRRRSSSSTCCRVKLNFSFFTFAGKP